MTALLSVHGLTVARGGLRVLENVSFDLAPGQALILRGPNGIGKTTLLRCVAGLQDPLAGTIDAGPDSVTYAAHADGLKTALTVQENLRFWARIFGETEIEPALAAMNLISLADRPAASLSAGQKRRVGLARLLVTGRPVWVLDEPTVSLDSASVGLFAAAIRQHLMTGGATLIATHIDLNLPMADVLDLTPYRAGPGHEGVSAGFNEAFA